MAVFFALIGVFSGAAMIGAMSVFLFVEQIRVTTADDKSVHIRSLWRIESHLIEKAFVIAKASLSKQGVTIVNGSLTIAQTSTAFGAKRAVRLIESTLGLPSFAARVVSPPSAKSRLPLPLVIALLFGVVALGFVAFAAMRFG